MGGPTPEAIAIFELQMHNSFDVHAQIYEQAAALSARWKGKSSLRNMSSGVRIGFEWSLDITPAPISLEQHVMPWPQHACMCLDLSIILNEGQMRHTKQIALVSRVDVCQDVDSNLLMAFKGFKSSFVDLQWVSSESHQFCN